MAQLTITDAAIAKIAQAQQQGIQVKLKTFELSNEPNNSIAKGNLLFTGEISNIKADDDNPNTLIAKCLLPSGLPIEDVIHKCFIYDEANGLFAYGRINSFVYSNNSNLEAEINIFLTFSGMSSVQLAAPVGAYVDVNTFNTHNHDYRYYLKSYLDAELLKLSLTGHDHDSRYYLKSIMDDALGGLLSKIDILNLKLSPVGEVMAFAGQKAPDNYLICNGIYLNRNNYSPLFNTIGTAYGATDSTNFRLPDLRGEFIRGWDAGRGADSGRGFATWQADQLKSHEHKYNTGYVVGKEYVQISGHFGGGSPDDGNFQYLTDPTGGNETRPRNIAMNYIIRYQ
jgi:hypothetical protein